MFDPLVSWYKGGKREEDRPKVGDDYSSSLWVFDVDKPPQLYIDPLSNPYPEPLNFPNALGSGSPYALGALYAGATLEEAVRVASQLDIYTGGDIKLYDIPVTPRPKAPSSIWGKIKYAVSRYVN